ncbi:MAG TPA: alpha/beta family hydrolase [Micromonosporaceae bacterium]|nr:alpha/beta family hydrolase [Micromonosporaceae bacterium]
MTLIETAYGPARVVVDLPAGRPLSLLVLGHGAGGDVDAPDLVAVAGAALDAGAVVARVTQPYRVAGRRAPAPAAQLDSAWTAAVTELRGTGWAGAGRPLIVGGRSSGARVACRTAGPLGAAGVVALAFPLHPPGRPDRSRAGELATGVPTLVVNGAADPFGVPAAAGHVEVCVRPGERHELRRDPAAVGAVVVGWLRRHGWAA